jgi:guanylate kinase
MRELRRPYYFIVTATTRPPRDTERDGADYIFLAQDAFRRMLDGGELMEWAEVYGNLYGVPKSQVTSALEKGRDVVVKTDIQGAATIRTLAPEAVFIFLAPPSMEELTRRLSLRMTESPETLRLRLQAAEAEMAESTRFEFTVVNHSGRLDDTVREIEDIVAAERARVPPRAVSL